MNVDNELCVDGQDDISLTEEDIWSEIQDVKKGLAYNVKVDISLLLSHLMMKFRMPDNDEARKMLKYQLSDTIWLIKNIHSNNHQNLLYCYLRVQIQLMLKWIWNATLLV